MQRTNGSITLSATDLVGHLSCRYLTRLDIAAANGVLERPKAWDPLLQILRERGAQTGEYGDLTSQGVIDPTKVVRNALQGAASIAGLLITTEAMVAELPKKEASHPPMPGGMGGMDY